MSEKDEEKPQKSSSKWLSIIVVIGVVVILVFLISQSLSKSTTGNVVVSSQVAPAGNSPVVPTKSCSDVQVPYQEQEEYVKTEYYIETVPYTDKECEAKYLTYKVEKGTCSNRKDNFFASDEPAKFDCTITNLDSEAGTFGMTIGFMVNGQKLEETQTNYIYPQSSEKFSISRDASVTSCYCAEQVPTKQVCRDVIKSRDVQRERQVTAYRPVTKYKTEQQCS